MGKITLIAAIGKSRELGKNNNLIWSIPEDLKFFRDNTINKTIVMGLNTFYSLPKLLPDRRHIVLSHKEVELDSSVTVFHSMFCLSETIICTHRSPKTSLDQKRSAPCINHRAHFDKNRHDMP